LLLRADQYRRNFGHFGYNVTKKRRKEDASMAYVINDACVSCGACAPVCPVEAIHEGEGKYEIDANCIDCGACAEACPVEAIKAGS
jgi:ferredoxin